jgi:hypothetical protein
MADGILFVFEGAKVEPQILENLKSHYFADARKAVVYATFDTHIYTLWDKVKVDKDLDLLEVIKQVNANKRAELAHLNRQDFSQIFLFFDYDGHVREASDQAIKEMLDHFDNETENGKLYVSYPMVEALKHIPKSGCFSDVVVSAKTKAQATFPNYKQLVAQCAVYPDITKLKKEHWDHIVTENLKKSNVLVNDLSHLPAHHEIGTLNQTAIFDKQLEKYIPQQLISVLSAFPFFIIEYFGEKALAELEPIPNPA